MMRLRKSGPALVAAASLLAAAPAGVLAAPHPNPSGRCLVTENVAPREITAGDPVVIFGRLICRHEAQAAQKVVRLFHHLPGQPGFSPVGSTLTDSRGFYEFSRADGRVETNRSWFVRSHGAQSPTRRIRVAAAVTLSGPPEGTLVTGRPVNFTGTVDPADVGARVLLQRQDADNGQSWHHIGSGFVLAGGNYSITHRFRVPGDANIRTLVRSQGRNIPSPSNVLEYQISQRQNPNLTINAVPDPITFGQTVTINGTAANSAGKPLTLLARTARRVFSPVAQVTAGSDGSYAFAPQMPVRSTFYEVRGPHGHSAVLYEGVKDALTASVSGTTVPAGQTLTFSGTVAPDHAGHAIYLQRQNANNGEFHVVEVSTLNNASAYAITHRFYDAGSGNYRVFIPGGPENGGARSQVFTITVTPASADTLIPDPSGNSTLPPDGQ